MNKMTLKQIRSLFAPGVIVKVTNHFLTREDHPCYGTNARVILKSSSSHLHFTTGGNVPWPKAANVRMTDTRTIQWWGFPNPDDLFLTFVIEDNMRELPVRKISILCIEHPEWGTFGVMEDRGDYYEIHGQAGGRVLSKDEAVRFWRVAA